MHFTYTFIITINSNFDFTIIVWIYGTILFVCGDVSILWVVKLSFFPSRRYNDQFANHDMITIIILLVQAIEVVTQVKNER